MSIKIIYTQNHLIQFSGRLITANMIDKLNGRKSTISEFNDLSLAMLNRGYTLLSSGLSQTQSKTESKDLLIEEKWFPVCIENKPWVL